MSFLIFRKKEGGQVIVPCNAIESIETDMNGGAIVETPNQTIYSYDSVETLWEQLKEKTCQVRN